MPDKPRSNCTTLLDFVDVAHRINGTDVISDLSLAITPGAPTVLLGPNGAGKTTLLKLAMALITPHSGSITFKQKSNGQALRRSFVFQKPVMLRRSCAANVAFALASVGRTTTVAAIADLLTSVGLDGLAQRSARQLSGGEQQRLALARALAREPDILFLDEPTASLDPASTKAIEDIIVAVAARGIKVVMATHDLGEAKRLAGDVIFLSKGKLVEHAAAPQFFNQPTTVAARQFLRGDLVL